MSLHEQGTTTATTAQSTGRGLQLGLDTFGDMALDNDRQPLTYAAAIRQVVEEAVRADELGLDVIALGEHHRDDYAISSPETVLAAIAARTERITLATGVTVLSSDDPVRVFQRFATVDALSGGRAQAILGRGSFTESFPLFGYDMRDYEVLFEEKLDLFVKLLDEKPVTWSGTTRPALHEADVFPKTESGRLDTWVGVGGSPQSVVRAARHGLPLMLAIIGGPADRFAPYVDLYRKASAQLGKAPGPVGVHSPGFIAETDEEAREAYFLPMKGHRDRIGAERGWGPMSRAQYEHEIDRGSMYVGSPETVARKIAKTVTTLDIDRFDMIYAQGRMTIDERMKTVELFAREVAPRVRELVGRR